MISPLQPSLRIAESGSPQIPGSAGVITRDFHRWLQLIERHLRGPLRGLFAPGQVVIGTDEYAIAGDEYLTDGNNEVALEGDSVLVVV